MKRSSTPLWKPIVTLSGLVALGACGRADRDGIGIGTGQLSNQYLVGGWVLKGEACESDGGVIYRPDGSWHADGASGTWRIDRDGLTYLVTEEEDELGRARRLEPPVRHVEQVEIVGPDEYVAHRADGSVRRLTRCPAG